MLEALAYVCRLLRWQLWDMQIGLFYFHLNCQTICLYQQSCSLCIGSLTILFSQANLRQFLTLVRFGELDKVVKLLEKGVDPNFQCRDGGGTILSFSLHYA